MFSSVEVRDREAEDNRIGVRIFDRGRAMIVRDSARGVEAGPGCAQTSARRARCRFRSRSQIRLLGLFISLGGGDDRLTVTARNAYGRTLPLVLIADGRGDDRIFGGRVNEAVFSGPGNDRMDLGLGSDSYMAGSAPDGDDRVDGGGGVNSVSYGIRTGPVTLDLKAGFGGGGAERDELDDFRAASGGEGDDLLLGGGAANSLDGGLGDDAIRSGAGDDYLDGIGGIDEFSAGGGRDFVWSRDGRTETVSCGAHRDGVYADADDLLIGCEREVGRGRSPFSALAPPPGFERAVRQESPTRGRWLRAVASRSRLAR